MAEDEDLNEPLLGGGDATGNSPSSSEPTKPGTLVMVTLAGIIFTDMALYTAITPLLPTYKDTYQVTVSDIGALVGCYYIVSLVLSPMVAIYFSGPMLKPLMVVSMFLLIGGTVLYGFASSFLWLIVARLMQSFSSTISYTAVMSSVYVYFEGKQAARAQGT